MLLAAQWPVVSLNEGDAAAAVSGATGAAMLTAVASAKTVKHCFHLWFIQVTSPIEFARQVGRCEGTKLIQLAEC
jgi:hypothetical protein